MNLNALQASLDALVPIERRGDYAWLREQGVKYCDEVWELYGNIFRIKNKIPLDGSGDF